MMDFLKLKTADNINLEYVEPSKTGIPDYIEASNINSSNPRTIYRASIKDEDIDPLYFLGRLRLRNVPLIVYFHGYNRGGKICERGDHSEYIDKYNYITIQDREGLNRAGSGFIGKSITLPTYIIILQRLISTLRKDLNPSKVIFAGASMGGFGCLMNSLFCEVDEVYSSVPQTSLNPEYRYYNVDLQGKILENPIEYSGHTLAKYLKHLGINNLESFIELRDQYPFIDIPYALNLLNFSEGKAINISTNVKSIPSIKMKLPDSYYHITAARYDNRNDINSKYMLEFIIPLIKALTEVDIHFSQIILPILGHDHYHEPFMIYEYSKQNFDFIQIRQSKINACEDSKNVPMAYNAKKLREFYKLNSLYLLK